MDAASEAEWKRRMAANKKAFQDMKERKALAAQIARSKAIAKQKLAWTKHQKRFGLGRFNPNRQRQQKTKVYNVYKQKVSGLGTNNWTQQWIYAAKLLLPNLQLSNRRMRLWTQRKR